jgi:hypothetical protein
VYTTDIFVRATGLKWSSFRRNWWNLYDVVAVTGTFFTTIPILRTPLFPSQFPPLILMPGV